MAALRRAETGRSMGEVGSGVDIRLITEIETEKAPRKPLRGAVDAVARTGLAGFT
jgi:hypothetical protein